MYRSGGSYGPPFKGYRGVTQGYPLSPKLFNMVIYTSICTWVTVVAATKAFMEVIVLLI